MEQIALDEGPPAASSAQRIEGEPTVSVAGRTVKKGDTWNNREICLLPSVEPPKQQSSTPPEVAQAARAMMQHQQQATMAARLVQGLPPVRPQPTPAPKYPVVTDHLLDGLGRAIQTLPEDERRQAIMEAHDHVTAALEEHGKAVVNGRLELLESPAQAPGVAAQIINQKIAEFDKAQASELEEARRPRPPEEAAQTTVQRPALQRPPAPAAEIPTEPSNVLSAADVAIVRRRLERAGYQTWRPVVVGRRLFFPVRRRESEAE